LTGPRVQLIEPKIAERKGRIVKLMGDGLLVEFPSAVEAVQCAVEIQHMIGDWNADVPKENRITYRVCEYRTEPIPSHPHRFVADIDSAVEQQIFDLPQ
jgi:hypothetical protein